MNLYKPAEATTTRWTISNLAALTLTNGVEQPLNLPGEHGVPGQTSHPSLLKIQPGGRLQQTGKEKKERKSSPRVDPPPSKLGSKPNLFLDGRNQGIPIRDPRASDDLAFKTGRRAEGTIQPRTSRSIPTHSNPFEPLSEPLAPTPISFPKPILRTKTTVN